MSAYPPTLSDETLWSIDPAHATAWRAWDGEMVVYDDLSGDTLKLDVIMTALFQRLQQGPAGLRELVDGLGAVLEMEVDPRLHRLVEITLERFVLSELVVAQPAPAPQSPQPGPEPEPPRD